MDDTNTRQRFSFSFSEVGCGPPLLLPSWLRKLTLSNDERDVNENVIGFLNKQNNNSASALLFNVQYFSVTRPL